MPHELKQLFRDRVADRSVSGFLIESELEPIAGGATPVAPPTYAGTDKKIPTHAYTEEAFVPDLDEHGWYSGLRRSDDSGEPRLAPRVVINSYGAESGRAETALWQQQERLGVSLPAVLVDGRSAVGDNTPPQLKEALDFVLSSWELAHRQNDGWLRYATDESGKQIWEQDENDPSTLKHLIISASAKRGDLLYRYFPNSALYGFWLSSGVAARHKLPRAYASEIVGYGAHPVASGATKLDATGGAPKSAGLERDKNGRVVEAKTPSPKNKPSLLGFGLVPGSPVTRTYVNELILQQSSVSLSVLRSLRFQSGEQSDAALTVLALLAASGHVLAGEDGFLRTNAALNPVAQRWGWRRQGARTPEAFDVPSVDDLASALAEAIDDAEQVGLSFAPTITVQLSDVEQGLIAKRIDEDMKSVSEESGEK